jgi:hypothetical protein
VKLLEVLTGGAACKVVAPAAREIPIAITAAKNAFVKCMISPPGRESTGAQKRRQSVDILVE